jgi:hypothetical protein
LQERVSVISGQLHERTSDLKITQKDLEEYIQFFNQQRTETDRACTEVKQRVFMCACYRICMLVSSRPLHPVHRFRTSLIQNSNHDLWSSGHCLQVTRLEHQSKALQQRLNTLEDELTQVRQDHSSLKTQLETEQGLKQQEFDRAQAAEEALQVCHFFVCDSRATTCAHDICYNLAHTTCTCAYINAFR